MKVYKQQGPICRSYAMAYAIQKEFGIIPTNQQIIQYDEAATTWAKEKYRAKYLSIPLLLRYMEKHPFCGVVVTGYNWLYNDRVGKYKKLDMGKLLKPYLDKKQHLLLGIRFREGGMQTDEWGVYLPSGTKPRGHHAIYTSAGILLQAPVMPGLYLKCVNSHGVDFGVGGYFLFMKSDLYDELQQAVSFKLKQI